MTRRAMRIPRQFRWFGLLETNCAKKKKRNNQEETLGKLIEKRWNANAAHKEHVRLITPRSYESPAVINWPGPQIIGWPRCN